MSKQRETISLNPRVADGLRELAKELHVSMDTMANRMLWKWMNPDRQPLEEIFGKQEDKSA